MPCLLNKGTLEMMPLLKLRLSGIPALVAVGGKAETAGAGYLGISLISRIVASLYIQGIHVSSFFHCEGCRAFCDLMDETGYFPVSKSLLPVI
jgi:hypothetical protein